MKLKILRCARDTINAATKSALTLCEGKMLINIVINFVAAFTIATSIVYNNTLLLNILREEKCIIKKYILLEEI